MAKTTPPVLEYFWSAHGILQHEIKLGKMPRAHLYRTIPGRGIEQPFSTPGDLLDRVGVARERDLASTCSGIPDLTR